MKLKIFISMITVLAILQCTGTDTPAQHFSGRGLFDRNATLWASWVIQTPFHSVFFSGDSGYFGGFKQIGKKYGPLYTVSRFLYPLLRRVYPNIGILSENLAAVMVQAGLYGTGENENPVLENKEIRYLDQQWEGEHPHACQRQVRPLPLKEERKRYLRMCAEFVK